MKMKSQLIKTYGMQCQEENLYYSEENLNRQITSKMTESVFKNLPTKESPAPDGFHW